MTCFGTMLLDDSNQDIFKTFIENEYLEGLMPKPLCKLSGWAIREWRE